jgi:hypothetical protein
MGCTSDLGASGINGRERGMTAKVLALGESRLERELKASLREIGIVYGPTWGDFKKAIATAEMVYGLTEATPFNSIDIGVSQSGNGRLWVEFEDGAVDVKEGRR